MMWFIDNGVLTRKKSTTAIPFEVEDGAAELIIPEFHSFFLFLFF